MVNLIALVFIYTNCICLINGLYIISNISSNIRINTYPNGNIYMNINYNNTINIQQDVYQNNQHIFTCGPSSVCIARIRINQKYETITKLTLPIDINITQENMFFTFNTLSKNQTNPKWLEPFVISISSIGFGILFILIVVYIVYKYFKFCESCGCSGCCFKHYIYSEIK